MGRLGSRCLRASLLPLVAFALFLGVGPRAVAAGMPYQNLQGHFSFDVPDGWHGRVAGMTDTTGIVSFVNSLDLPSRVLAVTWSPANGASVADAFQAALPAAVGTDSMPDPADIQDITLGGEAAKAIVSQPPTNASGIPISTRLVIVVHNDTIYALALTVTPPDPAIGQSPLFQDVLDSWQFTDD